MKTSLKNIVIVGGGVSGLELATNLGHKLGKHRQAKVTLIDHKYTHLWKPLLHKVAVGSLNEQIIDVVSYTTHACNHNFQFQLGSMIDIDHNNHQVLLDEIYDDQRILLVPARRIDYDILVIALGSTSDDFGITGVKEHCIFLDNLTQAKRFHDKMLNLFLKFSTQGENQEKKINIAIVGGGATGVELSAELHNAVQQLHSYSFKGLDNKILNITLLEASERILPALSPKISAIANQELIKLGVNILTKTMVTSVDMGGLHTNNGKYIQAELMVWATGIKAPDFMKDIAGLETNHINQLIVKPTLQTTRSSIIFAIGDCASYMMSSGRKVPPRAQAAHQMASCVYGNILALLHGKQLKVYSYKDHGSLVSLSRFNTVGSLMGSLIRGSMTIEGIIARAIYIFLYRIHQIALHGYIKTALIILISSINRLIRKCIKLY
ncbi:NADH dehydrogenase [Candidatus Gullanella endobia]|uniref:NADH dehydrogenase n=1 Tax=Candidatus Gullanella endobia TaxID=1070130 RepID=A0A143WR92_9ENTR|nr:NAD(P)/FAD-dependent oxidoreductase [Candidatus Gullanella endobia]CUX96316.1 NADH dehydrogenase [Candidatus Gullanella endobia]